MLKSFVFAATLLVAASSFSQPIGWWKFDEASGSLAAASAGGIDGTLVNPLARVSGIAGNAVRVESAGLNHVTFGNSFDLVGTSYSMGFWVQTSQGFAATDQVIVGRHRATFVSGYFHGMNANGPYGSQNKAWAYQSSLPGNQPISTSSVNDGGWHHVMTTFDMGTSLHRIYVDGVLEDTRVAAAMNLANADFMIGAIFNNVGTTIGSFTGNVDDLQIYGTALSSGDVSYLYFNPGQAVPEPMTLAVLGLGALALRRRRK